MRVKFPEYKGKGPLEEGQEAHPDQSEDWITEEASAHRRGDDRVQEDRRSPAGAAPAVGHAPPALAVGSMWGTFVKEFRADADPAHHQRRTRTLRQAYSASLDEASEPQKQRRAGVQTCPELPP